MSKRLLLTRLLHHSGALAAVLELRARTRTPWLSILTYHRFPDPESEASFDDGVIDITVEEFEQHVRCLKKHFTPIGVDELCAYARGGSLPRNAIAITFDDGYRDNHDIALPILRRHDCKAIFFVATSIVDQRRLYWWDRVAYLLKHAKRPVLELKYPERLRIELEPNRQLAIRKLLCFIKVQKALDLERLLEELSEAAGVPWSRELEADFAERLIMSWDQVRALRQAGMDVESHTRSHRVLQNLPVHELRQELEGSRADLLRELGEPARALAYPVGNPLRSMSPIRAELVRAGYELGFTNGTGPTPLWRAPDRFDIRRQTIGRSISEQYLLSILAIPPLAPKHPWHLTPL